MEKKIYTVEERIAFYEKEHAELIAAARKMEDLFIKQIDFVQERIKALIKEKTGTKEKS